MNYKPIPVTYLAAEIGVHKIPLLVVVAATHGSGRRILDVFVEPGELLPQNVLDGFLGAIAVGFRGQEHQTNRAAIAANRLVHAVRLDRERARVVRSEEHTSELQSPM